MAFSRKFKILCILYILSGCLCFFGQCQDLDSRVLQNISELSQNSSQLTLAQNATDVLSNHSSGKRISALNISKINAKNISLVLKRVSKSMDGKCKEDLNHVLNNLESPWALQMFDSIGKIKSGILRGAVHYPGHYSECLDVYAPLDRKGHGDFHGKYCTSKWTVRTDKVLFGRLTLGLCVPDSCSNDDILIAVNKTLKSIGHVPYLNLLNSFLTLNSVKCKTLDRPLDTPSIVYLCIVSVFIVLSVTGSLLALFYDRKLNSATGKNILSTIQAQSSPILSDQKNVDRENQLNTKSDKKSSCNGLCSINVQHRTSHTQWSDSVIKRVLLCFSILSNGSKLLSVEKSEGQLLSIHGLRVLLIIWVIYAHTYYVGTLMFANLRDILKSMDVLVSQVTFQSTFAVDSFFVLSGFFLAYLFLKEADKKNGKINWLHFYIHRIWRLTPSYLAVVFFYMLIFKYIGSGPLWEDDHCDAFRSTWWKYVLYIHNFIPVMETCPTWLWYLGNDMQFFVVSPMFLYPLWKWPKAGFSILGSILLATWTVTGVISYSNDLRPMYFNITQEKDHYAYYIRSYETYDLYYDKPYCRIATYIIGVILGYIFYKTAGRRNFFTRWQQLLGWTIALFCTVTSVFGLYHTELTRTSAMFYNVFARTSFAVGLSWLIYACETGHGGFITKFLSWRFFMPLSRLTYSAYFVHYIIIQFYYKSQAAPVHLTPFVMVVNFTSFFVFTCGASFIFSLIFESPFINLEKLFLKRKIH